MTNRAKTIILTPPATVDHKQMARFAVCGTPKLLLRLEAAAVLMLALIFYARLGQGIRWFAMLFLTPDLSLAGYLAGRRAGAAIYNAAHSYIAPALLLGAAYITNYQPGLSCALIWMAHIGLDRMLGYGMKYDTGFADTHLGRIGRQIADNTLAN